MKLEVIERKKKVLLGREDLLLKVMHFNSSTPSKENLLKAACSEFKLDEEKAEVLYIVSEYGAGISKALIRVYEIMKEVPGRKKEAKDEKKAKEGD